MLASPRSPVSSLKASDEVKQMPKILGTTGAKGKRSWFLRKDPAFAAPSYWRTCTSSKFLEPIRSKIRGTPPALQLTPTWTVKEPELLSQGIKHAQEIYDFWNAEAGKKGTTLTLDHTEIFKMLQESGTFCFGIRTPEGQLCATLVSRKLNGKYESKNLPSPLPFRHLDGAVVHKELRSRGVASWLFAWMDLKTQKEDGHAVAHAALVPQNLMKISSVSLRPATSIQHFSIQRHGAKQLLDRYNMAAAIEIPWSSVYVLMQEIQSDHTVPYDLAFLPSSNPPGITWWRAELSSISGTAAIIGVYNLNRPAPMSKLSEYIVTFVCFARTRPGNTRDLHWPYWEDEEHNWLEGPMASVAAGCNAGVLHVADCSTRGSIHAAKWSPKIWERKPEMKYNFYVYNTLVPNMGSADIFWPINGLI